LQQWATDWGIPTEAMDDLRARFGADAEPPPAGTESKREAVVQKQERLEAAKSGNCVLWRNNVGAFYTVDGRLIRCGLANESVAENKRTKSSDLIGIRRVLITEDHVGQLFGQFVARECKRARWVYRGNARETAQWHFLKLVASYGGDAKFTTGR
ncbi:MAG: hypothetical protein GY841_17590, partial [FCB group bacterium]|nr:hypothetical protein [FCB group bacterium]